MSDCLFCRIAAGEIPSQTIWEDDRVIAFLDINPIAEGHALVVPKEHNEKLAGLSGDAAAAVIHAAQRVIPAILDAVEAPDATLAINDGPAAGQAIPHVHLHIVPRSPGDAAGSIHSLFKEVPDMDDGALQDLRERIAGKVAA